MKKLNFLLILCSINIFSQNKVKKTYDDLGNLWCKKWIGEDKKIDSLKTYHRNGTEKEVFYFDEKSLPHGIVKKYTYKGQLMTSWEYDHGRKVFEKIEDNYKITRSVRDKKTGEIKTITDKSFNYIDLKNYTKQLYFLRKRLRQDLTKVDSLKYHKKNYNLNFQIALYYSSNKLYKHSINYYFLAIKSSKYLKQQDALRAYNNIAHNLYVTNDYELAEKYIDYVLEKHPIHAFANRLKANILIQKKQYEKALKHIEISKSREKGLMNHSVDGYRIYKVDVIKGYILCKLNNTEEGLPLLKKELDINRYNHLAHRYIGEIYTNTKETDKACFHLKEAKRLDYIYKTMKTDLSDLLLLNCSNENEPKKHLNFANQTKVSAFPNPTRRTVTIKDFNHSEYEYHVFTHDNRLVSKGYTKDNKINLERAPSGLIIIKLIAEEEIGTVKVLKH